MNQKKSRALRRQAAEQTIGKPYRAYGVTTLFRNNQEMKQVHPRPIQDPTVPGGIRLVPITNPIRLQKGCTRQVLKGLKLAIRNH
ncbi:MAG: hypothetical protein N0E44_18790 [Candidatus Thiodiazotropha lotti]|nr:hypothetical protein [Candidatus Thiodiazotropha lotti]MCW4221932.1 hypothetical protein [Candidatus Thiodiazotropha lotti]